MFESQFGNEMRAFLEIRKSCVSRGVYSHDVSTLFRLDLYLTEQKYFKKDLSEEILLSWIQTLKGKSKTVNEKILTVRNFVKYSNAMGGHSFMPRTLKVKSDYIPYIYSDEELILILHYADNLKPKNSYISCPYISAMIPMIIRILYGCGTRLGETLALKRKDIDFKARTIFLRETKNSKERLIPIHDSLADILEKYCLTLRIMLNPEAYLFPSKNGSAHIVNRTVWYWFTLLLEKANIDQQEKKSRRRAAVLHCYRHVFVLKAMQQLENAGHPVDMNDLLLPTYLGHECLIDTDKYMKFSGAQVPESLDAFESFTTGLIPNVEVPYEDE